MKTLLSIFFCLILVSGYSQVICPNPPIFNLSGIWIHKDKEHRDTMNLKPDGNFIICKTPHGTNSPEYIIGKWAVKQDTLCCYEMFQADYLGKALAIDPKLVYHRETASRFSFEKAELILYIQEGAQFEYRFKRLDE
jgi:hypothetical protein